MYNNVYRHIIKNSKNAYFYGDIIMDKYENIVGFKILDMNESLMQISGLVEENIIHNTLNNILSPEIDWIEILKEVMNKGQYNHIHYVELLCEWYELDIHKINNTQIYALINKTYQLDNYTKALIEVFPADICNKDNGRRYIANSQSILKSQTIEDGDARKDVRMHSVYTEQDDMPGKIGFGFDISNKKDLNFEYEELKKVMELSINKVAENEQQLNNVINGINDAIIFSDLSNIIYVNKAFEDIFEIKRSDFSNNPRILYELLPEESKLLIEKYNHDENYDLKFKINTWNGNSKWIWYKGYLLDSNDKYSQKINIVRDITDKIENDLKLEKLKIEFLSNITHEFKTPLNLIFSSLQLIKMKVKNNETNIDSIRKYIKIIEQNSLRLLKLTNNLIDTTKIESGYLKCEYENADIINFVEQIFNSIEEYANSRNIQLVFDTNVDEHIISFDMDKVERIILNLLSNAVKFNNEDGYIYLTITVKKDYTQISVKDTGIGIAKDTIESVFSRFTQVNNGLTKISEGSGIGLSLTKSLIEILEGNITIESEVGKGTEFIINIPNKNLSDNKIVSNITNEYNSFVKKLEIEFSDIYY